LFDVLRTALVELHGKLVETERHDYERLHGRVSDGEFLTVMVSNRDFSWLGALTTLIVHLDEAPREGGSGAARDLLMEIRKALTPGADGGEFNRKYGVILKRNSDVLAAQETVMGELDQLDLALSR
jgi:hypothetical protein